MDDAQKYELEMLVEELESYRGRHTEFITIYIPAGFSINQVAKQIEDEKGTATNIKSNTTRKNVINALEKASRKLKEIKETPKNGLALFSGNVSKQEGKEDLQVWAIEPPKPLKIRLYRCDQTFVLEPLQEMLETDEIYALLLIERKEATIGILEGKSIRILQDMTSGVPSKVRAGGQCLCPDTLVMKDSGEIVKLKDTHNPLIVLSENFNTENDEKTPIIAKWENKKELFQIETSFPKFKLKSSKDHTFFVRTDNGIEEKPLSEINEGDFLLLPEKINLNLDDKEIVFSPVIKQEFNTKKVKIPKKINSDFSRVLGYYLGDGSYEKDRISFFEQRKEVAEYYKKLVEDIFGIEAKSIFRVDRNYYQLRIYSRIVAQLFNGIFSEKEKTLNQGVPKLITTSSNNSLASFIAGFFDAEGYVCSRVALGINNELLAKQLQFLLLRVGIISSINEYDNFRNPYSNKTRYILAIDDLESLKKFQEKCNFCSKEKQEKLLEMIMNRSSRNKVRQLVVNGKEVARIIRNSGLNTRDFNCGYFFCNKRQMSKEVFKKRILDKISDNELRRRLEIFYNSNLIAVKIAKITSIGESPTIDIETKNHNFLANGLIVHNSSQRFHRITENAAKEFFRRVAETMKDLFFDREIKGILVGGPIPTKEEFLEKGQLVTKLKEKVIAVKDIGDTGMPGLKSLVEACEDVLAEQEITKQKQILDEFFTTLAKEPDKVTYGEAEVEQRLEEGSVGKLILSKSLDRKKIKKFEKLASNTGAEVYLVTKETSEGVQFDNLGGVGGILRFAMPEA